MTCKVMSAKYGAEVTIASLSKILVQKWDILNLFFYETYQKRKKNLYITQLSRKITGIRKIFRTWDLY